jgi:hypothetical protein
LRFETVSKTRRDESKSLSLVGKIFPTTDENHPDAVIPATFFTQQDFGNERTRYINDAEMRNAPDTTIIRRCFEARALLRQNLVFKQIDKVSDVR